MKSDSFDLINVALLYNTYKNALQIHHKNELKVVGNLAQCIVFVFRHGAIKYHFINNSLSYELKILMQAQLHQ